MLGLLSDFTQKNLFGQYHVYPGSMTMQLFATELQKMLGVL